MQNAIKMADFLRKVDFRAVKCPKVRVVAVEQCKIHNIGQNGGNGGDGRLPQNR